LGELHQIVNAVAQRCAFRLILLFRPRAHRVSLCGVRGRHARRLSHRSLAMLLLWLWLWLLCLLLHVEHRMRR
jgi:hypothetical protein